MRRVLLCCALTAILALACTEEATPPSHVLYPGERVGEGTYWLAYGYPWVVDVPPGMLVVGGHIADAEHPSVGPRGPSRTTRLVHIPSGAVILFDAETGEAFYRDVPAGWPQVDRGFDQIAASVRSVDPPVEPPCIPFLDENLWTHEGKNAVVWPLEGPLQLRVPGVWGVVTIPTYMTVVDTTRKLWDGPEGGGLLHALVFDDGTRLVWDVTNNTYAIAGDPDPGMRLRFAKMLRLDAEPDCSS